VSFFSVYAVVSLTSVSAKFLSSACDANGNGGDESEGHGNGGDESEGHGSHGGSGDLDKSISEELKCDKDCNCTLYVVETYYATSTSTSKVTVCAPTATPAAH
jgi:hypothetical protein